MRTLKEILRSISEEDLQIVGPNLRELILVLKEELNPNMFGETANEFNE